MPRTLENLKTIMKPKIETACNSRVMVRIYSKKGMNKNSIPLTKFGTWVTECYLAYNFGSLSECISHWIAAREEKFVITHAICRHKKSGAEITLKTKLYDTYYSDTRS